MSLMGGFRRVQMGGLGVGMGGLHGWVERWVEVWVRTTGSVYIDSLRLGGRKLPTYELTLRLLGVATMYGWILWLIHYLLVTK